jgi:integrase
LAEYWINSKNEKDASRITHELIKFFGGENKVTIINTKLVRDFTHHCRTVKRNEDSTINRKLAKLSKLLKFAKSEGLIDELPVIEFKNEPQGRIRFLSDTEVDLIFARLAPRNRALADFLLATGCRMGEALDLSWQAVERDRVTFWDTKAGDFRTIPLLPLARDALDRMRGEPQPFPIRYNTFKADWDNAKDHAGLTKDDGVVPHSLRHTCATRMVKAGVDLRRIQRWLGHKTINTTLIYAKLVPEDLFSVCHALAQVDTNRGTEVDGGWHGLGTEGSQPLGIRNGGMSRVAKGADCKSSR